MLKICEIKRKRANKRKNLILYSFFHTKKATTDTPKQKEKKTKQNKNKTKRHTSQATEINSKQSICVTLIAIYQILLFSHIQSKYYKNKKKNYLQNFPIENKHQLIIIN